MDKIEAATLVATTIVGAGTTKIIKTVIKNQVQPENIVDTVTVNSAAFVLGAMVANQSKKYTRGQIYRVVQMFREAKTKNQEKTEEPQVETTVQP